MKRFFLTVAIVLFSLTAGMACESGNCEVGGGEFKKLSPSCRQEVELIIQNSYGYYSPQDIIRILPYIRKANKHFYRCGNFEIAVGDDITVIVDTSKGIVYLSRYVFNPQGE